MEPRRKLACACVCSGVLFAHGRTWEAWAGVVNMGGCQQNRWHVPVCAWVDPGYPTLTRRTSRKRSVLHARNTSPRCILLGTLGEHRGSEALCTRAGLHIASCSTHLENSEEAKRITQAAPLRIELHSTHSGTRGSGAFYTRAAPRHTA